MPQLALPGMDYHLDLRRCRTAQHLGFQGERLLERSLAAAGYQVRMSPLGEPGDLFAQNPITGERFTIEVKTAKQAVDGKWRFTLRKFRHTDHLRANVVVLLAITSLWAVVPFVIPVTALAQQHQACITSDPLKYAGKLAVYRQSLETLVLERNSA